MVDECFFCGAWGSRIRLFDAIVDDGIVKICEKCSFDEHVPIIRKPTTFQLKRAEKKDKSFHERADKERENIEQEKIKKARIAKQNVTLKDIINQKYKSRIHVEEKPKLDLIDNFHWVILRARKKKHLTQVQLADAIQESEAVIKMIESGVLPEDDYRIVNKLENYLGIRIREKEEDEPVMGREPARVLSFKPDSIKDLTISDLQKMKKTKEEAEREELMDELKEKLKEEEFER